MGKSIVIAEKPSVGRDISRVLGCQQKGNGYFEGNQYVVTWALGHLVTLATPEKYDAKYEKWSLENLPIIPEKMKLEVIGQTAKQYKVIKDLLFRKDISQIIIATDAGREGELVARWILEMAKVRLPIKRLWISSVTDQAIRQGFSQLKDGNLYNALYASAVARSEADWLIGLNASRALTSKFNAQLNCGRVQTPTLAMINQREKEIRQFVPKTFYGLECSVEGVKFRYRDKTSQSPQIFDPKKLENLKASINGKPMTIIDVQKTTKRNEVGALYSLTDVQREANRLWGFSAKETLGIMQNLYEHHKVLTYPRTDSNYISQDIVPTLKERLNAVSIGPFKKFTAQLLKAPLVIKKSFVDDSKVSDHHAIIPTEQFVNLSDMSQKERLVYEWVVKRFLAVLLPAYQYEQLTMTGKIGEEYFYASGNRTLSLGWKELYTAANEVEEDEENTDIQTELKKGQSYKVDSLKYTEGKTKPPSHFTEGTLLAAMENPKKFMTTQDQNLLKTIGETGGLGTVATRADIIEKLFNSFLVEKNGKEIHITGKGKQLLELVPEALRSPELTAEWETKLGKIAKGQLSKQQFITEMENYTKSIVTEIKNKDQIYKHENVTGSKCPNCGKFMLEVKNKNGRMLVCQDRECGHRENLAQTSNARCPECMKKLELVGSGDGKLFVCKCGYREKLTSFNKRRSETTATMSKKEVTQFLQKDQKTQAEPFNNPFAKAFAQAENQGKKK